MGVDNGAKKEDTPMIGAVFGRLTVIDGPVKNKRIFWLCRCECGNEKLIRQDHLRGGRVVSCGCYNREMASKINRSHGMRNTKLYERWKNMKARCYSPSCGEFSRYGGRGISVCSEWQHFEPFCEWAMANGYRDELSLDRINNNGNYCPENCRWATAREQALNRSTNALITWNGITKHISEWDKEIGAKKSGRVRARLNAGWSVERAVTTPIANSGRCL